MMLLVAAVLIGIIVLLGKWLDEVTPKPDDPSTVRYTRYKARTLPRRTGWAFGLSWLVLFVVTLLTAAMVQPPLAIVLLLPVTFFVCPLVTIALFLWSGSVVDVRTDGLLLWHRIRPTRFWPYAELDEATLDTKSESIEVRAQGKRVAIIDLVGASEVVLQDIERGMQNAKLTNGPMSAAMDLDPKELGRASLGLASYRLPAPTREQLWSVVERRNAPRHMRIVAAKAIADTSAPGERKRIRIAAATSPDASFRRSLEALAEDEEAIDEAGAKAQAR